MDGTIPLFIASLHLATRHLRSSIMFAAADDMKGTFVRSQCQLAGCQKAPLGPGLIYHPYIIGDNTPPREDVSFPHEAMKRASCSSTPSDCVKAEPS